MYKGKISIHRFTSNTEPYSGMSITLDDDSSRVQVIKIELTMEEFGEAISGKGFVDCLFDTGRFELVGKVAENKTEIIRFKNPYALTKDEIAAILAPYEVDGWMADRDDVRNYHNITKNGIKVTFRRHVDAS